jgi:hypothetical protein
MGATYTIANSKLASYEEANRTIRAGLIEPGMMMKNLFATDARKEETDTGAGELSLRIKDGGGITATNIIETDAKAVIAAAGELVRWDVECSDIDFTREIRAIPVFKHTSTDADTPIFKLHYNTAAFGSFDPNADPPLAAAAEPTLDSSQTYTAHTCSTTANTIEWVTPDTSKGILPANTFRDNIPTLMLGLEADNLGSASANEIQIWKLILLYFPRLGKDVNTRN